MILQNVLVRSEGSQAKLSLSELKLKQAAKHSDLFMKQGILARKEVHIVLLLALMKSAFFTQEEQRTTSLVGRVRDLIYPSGGHKVVSLEGLYTERDL